MVLLERSCGHTGSHRLDRVDCPGMRGGREWNGGQAVTRCCSLQSACLEGSSKWANQIMTKRGTRMAERAGHAAGYTATHKQAPGWCSIASPDMMCTLFWWQSCKSSHCSHSVTDCELVRATWSNRPRGSKGSAKDVGARNSTRGPCRGEGKRSPLSKRGRSQARRELEARIISANCEMA